MKISDVADEILLVKTPFLRVGTQENHKIYLKMISDEIGFHHIDSFTLKKYMSWIKEFKKKSGRKTFDDYTKFINIIFRYAHNSRYTQYLAVFPKTDSPDKRPGRIYTDEELIRIWTWCKGDLKVQFVLAFECFMRLTEALHLSWDRVCFDRKIIILRKEDVKTGSKTGKGRTVPMSPFAFELLLARKKHSKSLWVFPNPRRTGPVDSNRKAWGILKDKTHADIQGRARWHDIRHTALTKATLQKKVPVAHLCQVAGLSIRTLERVYLHEQIEHLREVTESLQIKKIC